MTPILRQYPAHRVGEIRGEPAVFRGFSGASVYRIETDQGPFALRQWRQPTLNVFRLTGLHRLLARVHEAGVSTVAVPLIATHEESFVRHDNRVWQLEPWMPGNADFHQLPSRSRLRNAMQALADWHCAARTFHPRDSERTWFRCESSATSPAVQRRLEKLHDWQSGGLATLQRTDRTDDEHADEFRRLRDEVIALFRQHADDVAGELRSVLATEFRLQPCLRDIWHEHLLFTGDDVTGLIDATACRTENIATDLARLLGSLVADDAADWRFALDAYHAVAPMSDNEFRLVRILDRSAVLMSGLTWMDRYYFQRISFFDAHAVLQRIRKLVQRMRRL